MSDISSDYPDRLNLREQLARIDNLLADTQGKQRELAQADAISREQLARIDNLLADTQKKQRGDQFAPWQVLATVLGGAAACFAAGAAFVKLVGG